jgi:mannose-6-phosphate isomerase-like protein (cupin superfamily)
MALLLCLVVTVGCASGVKAESAHLGNFQHYLDTFPLKSGQKFRVDPTFPDRPCTVHLMQVASTMAPRNVPNTALNVFITEGKGRVWLGEDTESGVWQMLSKPIKPGAIIQIPPGIPHAFQSTESTPLRGVIMTSPDWDARDYRNLQAGEFNYETGDAGPR